MKVKYFVFGMVVLMFSAYSIAWVFFGFERVVDSDFVGMETQAVEDDFFFEEVDSYVPENSLPKINDKSVELLFFGDLMLDRNVKTKIDRHGFDYLFSELKEDDFDIFENKDLVACNLEGTVTNNGKHYRPVQIYDFAFASSSIESLMKYNFNLFCLANNHFSDQGEKGERETRDNLKKLGVDYFGCRDKVVGDCSSKIIDIKNKKIAFFGFSMVYGMFDVDEAVRRIKKIGEGVDYVITNIHWGVEYEHNFNSVQVRIAESLIDGGSDVVIGHHPHVVQGMSFYKGRPIFYSLGNFIFDQYFSPDTQEGLALYFDYSENELIVEFIPFRSRGSRIVFIDQEEKEKFINRFISWSDLSDERRQDLRDLKIVINFNDNE